MPPFAFPSAMKPIKDFRVYRIVRATRESDGAITLHRNDRQSFRYLRADGPVGDGHHLIVDESGLLKPTDHLEIRTQPQEIFVKSSIDVQRYAYAGTLQREHNQ
jgi:hypothetical protein